MCHWGQLGRFMKVHWGTVSKHFKMLYRPMLKGIVYNGISNWKQE